jgi:hypothetical protein
VQHGVVGDMTASRKAKVPEIPIEEVMRLAKAGLPWPWHWANSVYLEWFSERNGRVVIESSNYQIEISAGAAWVMDDVMEQEQCNQNAMALTNFMDLLCKTDAGKDLADDGDDDAPRSRAEAQADADAAYMDRLPDRVEVRMEREGWDKMEDYPQRSPTPDQGSARGAGGWG